MSAVPLQARQVPEVPAPGADKNATYIEAPTNCGWNCYSESSCMYYVDNTYSLKNIDHIDAVFKSKGEAFWTTSIYSIANGPIGFPVYVMPELIKDDVSATFNAVDMNDNRFLFEATECPKMIQPIGRSPPPPHA